MNSNKGSKFVVPSGTANPGLTESLPSNVVIIDDDLDLCDTLSDWISIWGMRALLPIESQILPDYLASTDGDAYLLDVHMPGYNGLDLLPLIREYHPDAKIIIMTGFSNKETVIRAFRLGAFDYLEKPFPMEFLHHSLCVALEVQQNERKNIKLFEDLTQSRSELLQHKKQLEDMNRRLLEINSAFAALARNIDFEKEELEKRILTKMNSMLIPLIKRLMTDPSCAKYLIDLELVMTALEEMASGLSITESPLTKLSSSELMVASLIKAGLTTREIAEQLYIAESTVQTHRKNIRKKLKVSRSSVNLNNLLSSPKLHVSHRAR